MLSFTHSLKSLSLTTEVFATNYTNLITRRWARKPISLGTAKSKLFRVPKRPQIPIEEAEEIKRLFNNYRTNMKSVRKYLESKYAVSTLETSDPEQQKKIFEEDFARCMEINDQWNAQQKVLREKQMADRLQREIELAKSTIAEYEKQHQLQMEQIEDIVRQEKERSKTFITPDSLDEAIENALANVVDYNYAIDLEGNKYYGRETIPESQKHETPELQKEDVKQ